MVFGTFRKSQKSNSLLPTFQQHQDDQTTVGNGTSATRGSNNTSPADDAAAADEVTSPTPTNVEKNNVGRVYFVSRWCRPKKANRYIQQLENSNDSSTENQYQLYPVEYNEEPNADSDKNKKQRLPLFKHSKQNDKNNQPSTLSDPSDPTNNNEKHIVQELCHWYINRSWKKKLLTTLVVMTMIPVTIDLFILKTGYVQGFLDRFLDWMRKNDVWGVWAYIAMLILTSCECFFIDVVYVPSFLSSRESYFVAF